MLIVNETEGMAPCQEACPAHINVPRYLRHIANGDFEQALDVINEKIPFPSICGYICSRPCERKCNMNYMDGPIAIRALKRIASEKGATLKTKPPSIKTGKKVAVIGSGPAGLTAAFNLTRLGHDVYVFESQEKAGGSMRLQISQNGLTEGVLNSEIDLVREIGFNLHIKAKIESINDLFIEGYDAVLAAVGIQRDTKTGVYGEGLDGLINLGLSPTEKGRIKVDDDLQVEGSKEGLFACGDVVTGTKSVIYSIASGRKAAESVDRYLGGTGDISRSLAPPEKSVSHFMPDLALTRESFNNQAFQEHSNNPGELDKPSIEEVAMMEAGRCLRCDLPIIADTDKCSGCITCELICSLKENAFNPLNAAIKINKIRGGAEYDIVFDANCDNCGLCVRYCPRKTLTRERREES